MNNRSRQVKSGAAGRRTAVVLVALLAAAALSQCKSEKPVGTTFRAAVVFVKGSAAKIAAEGSRDLHPGDFLNEKDTIKTGADSAIEIVFGHDQSIVRLQSNAELQLATLRTMEANEQNIDLNLKQGSALNHLEKLSKNSKYMIHSPSAIASVRGTSFEMVVDGNTSIVLVAAGAVRVDAATGPKRSHDLEKNQMVIVTAESTGEKPRTDEKEVGKNLPEYEQMKTRLTEMSPLVQKAEGIVITKSEVELRKKYNRELELLSLKDGRQLRGVVVDQQGERLIVHAVDGVHIIKRSDILKVKMLQ